MELKRSDAGWQEDAESNSEVRLSNSSKASVVKCEVGARVTRMHIIVAAESAFDQGRRSRARMAGTALHVTANPRLSLQADRYVATTDGRYR